MPDTEPAPGLGEEPPARVQVQDGVVHRPAQPWTPTVHALLEHLHRQGLTCVPRPVGIHDGVETVTALEGEAGAHCWPHQATDRGLASAARLLRSIHDACRGWDPPPWSRWAVPARQGADVLVCHGDPGPWNMVWQGGEAVGLFDWDIAHPAPALDDIAYALQYFTPFRDDAEALRWLGFTSPPRRSHRLRVFADAYGGQAATLTSAELADAVVAEQVRGVERVAQLARQGVEPQRTWVEQGHLDELQVRVNWSDALRF
ncbi:MAG: phosphotransferase [Quadrisphaera sp.]